MDNTLVHFATNRNEIETPNGVIDFGQLLNPKSPLWLRFGTAVMEPNPNGPPAFRVSHLNVQPENISNPDDPGAGPTVLGSDTVFDGLRERLIGNKADLVMLLHGYACTFREALSNAAEIKTKWATPNRPLEVVVFAWPANGTMTPLLDYASDRDDARASAKAIARALERFMTYLRKLPAEQQCRANIHVVAHSMGNYALRNAFQALLSVYGGHTLPRLFKNIFLMAPDEDSDAFELLDKMARLPELAEMVHLYFAGNDGALAISDVTKGNPDRLGSTGPRTLTLLPQKVSLVDCGAVSDTPVLTDVRHQYYRKRAEVIADVQQILAGVLPEDVRNRDWVHARHCFRIKAAP